MTSTPTKKPIRLSIPITPEAYEVFQRLSTVSGRSFGASVSQWLMDTREAASLMADNLERLREAPGELMARVKLHISAVEDAAQMAIDDAISRAEQDEFEGRPRGRKGLASDAPKGPAKPLTPPSSNTGGKVHGSGKKSRGS